MNYKTKSRNYLFTTLLLLTVTLLWGTTVYAGPMELPKELSETAGEAVNTVIYVTHTTEGYEKADTSSTVVSTLEKGQKVLMMNKIDDDWCQIMNEGKSMYIQRKYIEMA